VLSDSMRRVLHQLVMRHLPLQPDIDALIALLGPEHGPHELQGMRYFRGPFDCAVWIVRRVLADPTKDRFCRLAELVDPGDAGPELRDYLAALRSGRIAWEARHSDPMVVDGDQPFVDRESVRGTLAAMFTRDAPVGCLVVSGGAGEGKSHLRAWCTKLAAGGVGGRLAAFELNGSLAASIGPGRVVTKLATDLGLRLDRLPRTHEDHERWAQDLGYWLLRNIHTESTISVLVFDGFHHPQIQPSVHTLIRALIRARQEDPEIASLLRIVLLGYDAALLERNRLAFELRVLEVVDQQMIRDWLVKRYPGRRAYEYDDTAADVWEHLDPGPTRMFSLCQELQRVGPTLEEP